MATRSLAPTPIEGFNSLSILLFFLVPLFISRHVCANVNPMEGEAEVINLSSLEQDLESGTPLALTERERDLVSIRSLY